MTRSFAATPSNRSGPSDLMRQHRNCDSPTCPITGISRDLVVWIPDDDGCHDRRPDQCPLSTDGVAPDSAVCRESESIWKELPGGSTRDRRGYAVHEARWPAGLPAASSQP